MKLANQSPLPLARRSFLGQCGLGLGRMALASLLADEVLPAAATLAAKPSHFPGKAKSIIYLFMEGGPSQLDLFVDKPKLKSMDGQDMPKSLLAGKKFAFMDQMGSPKICAPKADFARHGQSGNVVSSRLPRLSKVADEIAFLNAVKTNNVNHSPAMVFAHTGAIVPGRPSFGAWLVYGLGSESKDLPAFVAMQSGPRGPRNATDIIGSGFLPTTYQGVPFLNGPEPIFDLKSPDGIGQSTQSRAIEALRDLNRRRLEVMGDSEVATRIASYEMAYRMQTSAPELMDLSGESEETLDLYGAKPGTAGFGNNCLLARRLIERGVRCVQVNHTDWDHHNKIEAGLDKLCPEVDRGSAGLIADLKRRGLLENTLVIWGGEFGRTPMSQKQEGAPGRNHQIDAYSVWMAGGGVKGGQSIGETDELGLQPVADSVHVHDLHATILHLFGLDHTRLTYGFQGRNFRLTDVAGSVVRKLVA
ncbi:MAG: DUF1501 domain-containing protein [Bryobacteraceae bacterium]